MPIALSLQVFIGGSLLRQLGSIAEGGDIGVCFSARISLVGASHEGIVCTVARGDIQKAERERKNLCCSQVGSRPRGAIIYRIERFRAAPDGATRIYAMWGGAGIESQP